MRWFGRVYWDWTIVRPSALADGPADGAYNIDIPSSERRLSLKIARAHVAGFLTRSINGTAFLHRAVGISH